MSISDPRSSLGGNEMIPCGPCGCGTSFKGIPKGGKKGK